MKFPKPTPKAKARKPLKRSGWIKRKPARRIAREAPMERAYKRWIHTQPCVLSNCLAHPCKGPLQQSHERNPRIDGVVRLTGSGLKEKNERSISSCAEHHAQFGLGYGFFAGWVDEAKREWMRQKILEANERFAARWSA